MDNQDVTMKLPDLHMTGLAGLRSRAPGLRSGRAKRLFDLTLAMALVPAFLPIIALLLVLVRLDGGPGLFGHLRVGRDNRMFRCWKIRTMVPDAESILKRHLAANRDAAAEWERDFKLADDPRVTRIGRFLRATSLDELPQLWNVLRGEMSFVGPRPVTAVEIPRYQGYAWCYLSVNPGITGLWQVSGRNSVSYEDRVRMDMRYLQSQSLLTDVSIIWRTVGVVLNRTGR